MYKDLKKAFTYYNSDKPLWMVFQYPVQVPLVEAPYEHYLEESDLKEGLVRVFMDKKEALIYASVMAEINYITENDLIIKGYNWYDMWTHLKMAEEFSVTQYDAPIRVDLCAITENEWPESLDILWSTFETRH